MVMALLIECPCCRRPTLKWVWRAERLGFRMGLMGCTNCLKEFDVTPRLLPGQAS